MYRTINPVPRQSAQPAGFLEESDYASFSEIVVSNTGDSGTGTLRDAVAQVNRVAGNRRIVFRLPTSDPGYNRQTGVWRITLKDPIILQTNKVLLDGLSQAKFSGETNPNGPEIQIYDGIRRGFETLPGQNSNIFLQSMICIYNGSQNWIRGFNFGSDESFSANSWGGPQICHFNSDTNQFSLGNKITDNWLGLSASGDLIESNLTTPGISLGQGASFNLIEQNVICAYGLPLLLSGPGEINSVKGNLITRNYFGTNKTGTRRLDYKSNTIGPFFVPATYIDSDDGVGGNIIENNIFAGQEGGAIGRVDNFGGTSRGDIIRNNRIGIGPNGEDIAPKGNPDILPPPGQEKGEVSIGIFAGEGDTVTNNIIANFPYCGIKVGDNSEDPDPSRTTTIQNNQIINTPVGIQVANIRTKTIIQQNRFENCPRGGITVCSKAYFIFPLYFPAAENREKQTNNITISNNTFVNVGGPGIALTEFFRTVFERRWVPNQFTELQSAGPNNYQPSVRLASAKKQKDGSIVVSGTSPGSGTMELCASQRPALPNAPATEPLAYGLGNLIQSAQIGTGAFQVTIPADKTGGITDITATLTVNNQTSEFARTVAVTPADVDPPPDTVKPMVSVTSPAQGLVVESRPNAQVEVIWQSSDNVGVTGHWVKLNGTRNGTPFEETLAAGLPGTATSFTLQIAENDAYSQAQLTVSATDAAGNPECDHFLDLSRQHRGDVARRALRHRWHDLLDNGGDWIAWESTTIRLDRSHFVSKNQSCPGEGHCSRCGLQFRRSCQ
ncbi:MAG: right-handed parallel beta-helix repeat-containing protein [Acidobacteria bacterium]|nr:right-handed parallel beta-helix repeat-containing protein [Acidobacteriota bacterium]